MADTPTDEYYVQSRERAWQQHCRDEERQPYGYTPLSTDPTRKEIRLLEILPSDSRFHVVYCKIHHVPLHGPELRPYEALSYCWGGSSLGRWIAIHGDAGMRYLNITDNLYFALWRLRDASQSRWMWIDAVCIDQNDSAEKAAQVLVMRDIYASSKRAVLWLGEKDSDGSSERGLELVFRVHIVLNFDKTHNVKRDLFQQSAGPSELPPPTSRLWWDLFALLNRSWFSRAWIVQELAVSPDPLVLCGYHQLPWTHFWGAINYLGEIAGLKLGAYSSAMQRLQLCANLDQIRKQYQQQGQTSEPPGDQQHERVGSGDEQDETSQSGVGLSVMEALMYSRKAEATMPQDRLFAFYGLLSAHTTEGQAVVHRDLGLPDPNYLVPAAEIYRQAAVGLMQHLGNLDLLSVTSITRERWRPMPDGTRGQVGDEMAGLPTWAPNWTAGGLTEPFLWRHFLTEFRPGQKPTYRASGDSAYAPEFDASGQRLRLRGHVIGVIGRASQVVRPPPKQELDLSPISRANWARGYLEYQRALRSCEDVGGMWEPGNYPATGESRIRAYCQTLHGGADGFLGEGITIDNVEFLFRIWHLSHIVPARILQILRLDTVGFFVLWTMALSLFTMLRVKLFGWPPAAGPDMIFTFLTTRLAHRRVINTEDQDGRGGYIGLGPPLAQPGDSIVLCMGGKLPLVLRPSSEGAWEFIGECYIHGLQDGRKWEALESRREADKESETEFWLI